MHSKVEYIVAHGIAPPFMEAKRLSSAATILYLRMSKLRDPGRGAGDV